MGLAASQARYLALTARKSDLEFQSQTINTRRLQLAYRTQEIAAEYSAGMNNKRICIGSYNAEGDKVWNSLSFGNLLDSGYVLIPIAGDTWYSVGGGIIGQSPYLDDGQATTTDIMIKDLSNLGSKEFTSAELGTGFPEALRTKYFDAVTTGTGTAATTKYKLKADAVIIPAADYSQFSAAVKALYGTVASVNYKQKTNPSYGNDSKELPIEALLTKKLCQIVTKEFYNFLRKQGYNPNDPAKKMTPELFAKYQEMWDNQVANANPSGKASIVDWRADETETFAQKNYTDDDAAVLAKYERETAEVQAQDKVLELQEKQIETQHKAIETELESIQKVIQNNIEKTFKIFS